MEGLFEFQGRGSSDWVCLIAHGSTQIHYDENHLLVRALKKYVHKIYTVDLPGHGSLRSSLPSDVQGAVDLFYETALPAISGKKVILLGFSMGGIFSIKAWKRLKQATQTIIGIMIGVGLYMSDAQLAQIRMFFTERHYRISGWVRRMEDFHGPDWKRLVEIIGKWFDPSFPQNALFSKEEREMVVSEQIFFIIGNRDQAFSLEGFSILPSESIVDLVNYTSLFTGPPTTHPDPLSDCDPSKRVFIISGHHFSYFHPKAGFPIVHYIIDHLLRCTLSSVGVSLRNN